MKVTILHIVNELGSPGGLEKLVLDLQKFASAEQDVHIASLVNNKNDFYKLWTAAEPEKIHFLNKQAGKHLSCLAQV